MKETGPEAFPFEPERNSCFERNLEKLEPAPEPPLNKVPSVTHKFKIERMSSWTELMKHAEHCCGRGVPTLNQTGELNAAI